MQKENDDSMFSFKSKGTVKELKTKTNTTQEVFFGRFSILTNNGTYFKRE